MTEKSKLLIITLKSYIHLFSHQRNVFTRRWLSCKTPPKQLKELIALSDTILIDYLVTVFNYSFFKERET